MLRPLGTPSLHEVMARVHSLGELAERGFGGDEAAYSEYQGRLFDLHNDTDPVTDVARRFVADQLYRVEERYIAEPDHAPVPVAEFRAHVDGAIAGGRRRHPMSLHLYDGTPSRDDIRSFIRHHWLRSCMFFGLVAEAALRLPDFEDWAVLYDNLYDETGEGDATRAHPVLLRRLMEELDLPADYHARSEMWQEQAYLNNRIRCVRHPDPAWGLAVLYAIEVTTSSNHHAIHLMLRRAGFSEPACEFHRLHGETDDGHAERLWELVARRAHDPTFQATFVRSLRHHFSLTARYFDALWADMRRDSP